MELVQVIARDMELTLSIVEVMGLTQVSCITEIEVSRKTFNS